MNRIMTSRTRPQLADILWSADLPGWQRDALRQICRQTKPEAAIQVAQQQAVVPLQISPALRRATDEDYKAVPIVRNPPDIQRSALRP